MALHTLARATLAGALVPLFGLVGAAQASSAEDAARPTSATPLTPDERVEAHKAPSSRLAQTDPELLARDDSRTVNVVIKLDYDSVATYTGGAGLAPTSPSVTGRELAGTTPAERAYERYAAQREDAFVAELTNRVPQADVGRSLRTVYGGVAASIPANAVETVLDIDGVVAVQHDELQQPLTDSSPEFVNATAVYDLLGTTANAGEGIIYGNIDTGIWPEHPSFADLGNLKPPPGPARECNYGDNPLTPANDPFDCNNKLIGGAHFTDTYDAVVGDDPLAGFARDAEGHGTHTASTTAGNIVDSAPVFGVDRGPIQGLAPGAWVMEYKVCGPQGCFASDSAAAVGQAILDGVDVINFSISGGTNPFTDPVELAFLDAYAADVFVSASAGNEGPGAGTANHLSPWVTSVAASTQTREFATTLTLTADNGDTFTADGASITQGIGELPVVMADTVPGYEGDPLCENPAPAGIFEGLIVACERGVNARVAKGFNVLQGGADAMILFNPSLADIETDNHWLPTVHLADGTDFEAFMASHSGVTGSFLAGEARDGQGDVMAAFSSRGPAGLFIKPDVTAPGVQILAGASPFPGDPAAGAGSPGELYQAIAGTSMSAPHVAGAAALVRATHPDWSPGQIKSALMTTAITDVLKEDLATPADPFDVGAGRIDIGEAALASITFDETAERFFALGNDPVNAVHLNLPSVNAPVMPGRLVTTRVATNTSGRPETFRISTDAPEGSTITVHPRRLTVLPGQSKAFTVIIESDAPIGDQQFGSINLSSRRGEELHLPVAFIHTQGSVSLVQACSPETIHRGGVTTCEIEATNNSFEEQVVDLDTRVTRGMEIVGADGAAIVGRRHAQLNNVTLASAEPGVPSVDPGALFGYLPLDAFGVTPIAVGDETLVNFEGPPIVYNGQTWTRFGVTSNGYVLLGDASSEDVQFAPPDGPNPARPNNVLAPFWTDLNGEGATGVFVANLTDGVNNWIVVEYRLFVFGTTSERVFQIWMGVNGVQDITYAYVPDRLPADPAGQPFLVGAENVIGQGDMEAVLPTEDLRVTSTDPVPGDQASYTVTVRGLRPGTGSVTTEMEASRTPGVTVVESDIRIIGGPGGAMA